MRLVLLVACLSAVLLPDSASAAATGRAVGFAVRDVTPAAESLEAGETWLAGYGLWKARGPADAVHDPLTARALCVTEDAVGFCLAVVDNLGLPGSLADRISALAAAATGLAPDQILVAATHTHAAPDLLGLWGGAPDAYREYLVAETVAALVAAYAAREPAELLQAVGQGQAFNRRGWGYTDPDLIVLQARARESGRLIGTLINFAAHPTVADGTNRTVSSDFVHYLRRAVEQETGAPAVFANGALGDAVPPPLEAPDWTDVEGYGARLAAAVLKILPAEQPVGPGLASDRRSLDLAVDNFTLGLAQLIGVLDESIDGPLWSRRVRTVVSHVALGDTVEIVTVPGEPLTRLGLEIKAGMTAPVRMVIGQTGGSLGYLISDDEWATGRNRDYEESVSLGRSAGPAILEAAAALTVRSSASRVPDTHEPAGAARE